MQLSCQLAGSRRSPDVNLIGPVTIEIARCSGALRRGFAARGQQRTQADMLIAATAQVNQLTLVTRNVRDFEDCGVTLLDPFS